MHERIKNTEKQHFMPVWSHFLCSGKKNDTDTAGGLTILSMALFDICTIIPQISPYSKI